MSRERILEKIKKCLALGKSPNENEAAAGLRQAAKLMEMHDVTEDEIGLVGMGSVRIQMPIQASKKVPEWIGVLQWLVADTFGVLPLISTSRRVSDAGWDAIYVGPKHRIIAAEYAHTVLYRAAMGSWEQFRKDNDGAQFAHGVRTSYLLGFLARVKMGTPKMQVEESESEIIRKYTAGISTGEVRASGSVKIDESAMRLGARAGSGFTLRDGVGTDGKETKLLGN